MLDLMRLAVDFGLVVLIWLVQLVIYPSFRYYDAARLRAWHERYTLRVSWVVVPLMFAQIGLYLAEWNGGGTVWLAAASTSVLLAWAMTFLHAVPCHQRIATERDPEAAIRRLLQGNAVRTIAWSLALAFDGIGWWQESTKL